MGMYRDENGKQVSRIEEEDMEQFEELNSDLDEKFRYVREKGNLQDNFTLADIVDGLYRRVREQLEEQQ